DVEHRPQERSSLDGHTPSQCLARRRPCCSSDSSPYYGGSGAVSAYTLGRRRPRSSCKSALPAVSMMPARDRTCSTCCTRLVPAHCCLFSKHTTERVDATDHHDQPLSYSESFACGHGDLSRGGIRGFAGKIEFVHP